MTRFLAYTSPARGHLYPIVETLRELGRRGHEVHVRTLASQVPILEREGLRAASIAPVIERLAHDDWEAGSFDEALSRTLRVFAQRSVHEVPDLEAAIDEVAPDALLIDITTVGAAALAEASRLPWAQTIPFFRHISPFGLDAGGLEVLNAPRRRFGLEPLGDAGGEWRRAPLYLSFTAPPFAPEIADASGSFRFVGPGRWEPPASRPAWLNRLDDPLVLIGASSEFQRDDVLIETALAALANVEGSVVVTTAAHDPGGFTPVPNARAARWLPHSLLVDRATCVVSHGGMGLTQKALAAGVPVCVVPFGRDQFEVADRVVRIGAGTSVQPRDLHPASLRAAIERAVGMRPGARRVAASFGAAGGAAGAADALESLVPAARAAPSAQLTQVSAN